MRGDWVGRSCSKPNLEEARSLLPGGASEEKERESGIDPVRPERRGTAVSRSQEGRRIGVYLIGLGGKRIQVGRHRGGAPSLQGDWRRGIRRRGPRPR